LRWKKSNFSESLESLSEATNLYFSSVPEHYLKVLDLRTGRMPQDNRH